MLAVSEARTAIADAKTSFRPFRPIVPRLQIWLRDPFNLCFLALLALNLLPIWLFEYFPSQDGPSHLNNANVLREYPWRSLEVFRQFYTIDALPLPNWSTYVALAALMKLLPALVAEKILLSAYVIALPTAIRYCIRGLNPTAAATTLLGFPLAYNAPFQLGFYNFSSGVVMFFVCVGYWLKRNGELSALETLTLMLLSVVLYFCHLVALALACITMGSLWAWFTFSDWYQLRHEARPLATAWAAARRRAIRTLLALLPALLLALWYLRHQGTDTWGTRMPPLRKMRELFVLTRAHQSTELWALIPWECLLIALAVFALRARLQALARGPLRQDAPLFLFAVVVLLYLTLPNNIGGGGGIELRMALYTWLTLVWWLAAQSYGKTLERAIAVGSVAFAAALLVLNSLSYSVLNDYLKEYLSAARFIEPGSTLLPLELTKSYERGAPIESLPADPFRHAAGYIAAQKHVVEFSNYEADADYFPTHFLASVNPYSHIGDAETRPYKLDFLSYKQRTGVDVDYVLLWGEKNPEADASPDVQSVLRQLHAGYEQVYVSPQRGLVRLYRRVDLHHR